ncbi:sodium/glutamate symporter [Muriventricola aceti]|uniref:sodium/glutamate symporter n=1 Tax=Muriventricola aceti TaxID=2981773 RepID=UPI00082263E2|nr:sodium/glutamate symporter [Muriventricola aceti]MCU6701497.1 hypothetical protein [Muriventricola aceti]SCI62612.1 Sodium/glutamate symporter [uncultured Flavonifractor sp.]
MNEIATVMYDLGILSVLLLLGICLRKKIRFFQNIYIPASLLGGFCGLLLGPQVLGHFFSVSLPIGGTIGKWPGVLVNIVLGVSFFGATQNKKFGRTALSAVTVGGIVHQVQVVAGLIVAMVMMMFYTELPLAFGLTPVYGFHGGHGTANAAGAALEAAGWADGVSVANTMATAGLLSGIIIGMVIINIGVRRGYAKLVSKPQDVPRSVKEGIVPMGERTSIGMGVTYNDALDPLALQLSFVGIILLMAKLLAKGLIAIHPILSNVPDFACAMISGAVLSFIMKKAGLSHYIDRATINRISGVALDFLVCSAIATLSVKVFALYFVPMITTIAVIIVLNLITNFYFSWKVFDDDWFERAIASYGLESGVLATGLMLLRVVDPKFETTGRESAAASAALCYPWSLPYVMLMPALAFSLSPMTILGFSVLLLVVFLVVARVFFWHPERKFSDILSGSSSRPVQNEEALR